MSAARIRLELPSPEYKDKIMAYKADFLRSGDSMDGSAGLADAGSFEEWYSAWRDNLSEETVRPGLVPATTFIAVDENDDIAGMIDVRHRLNEYLLRFGGHIGYSVTSRRRREGIATEMLALALEKCAALGICRVLITCDRDNAASAGTIKKNGGVLENEVPDGDRVTCRYWIEL